MLKITSSGSFKRPRLNKFLRSQYFSKKFEASRHCVLEDGVLSLNPFFQPARVADMLGLVSEFSR